MIGSSMLASLLSDRKDADEQLKIEIGQKTAPWGISVSSVEIRDVAIPVALQDAMSRQAQAEREKQARVILGSAEAAIAGKFVEAANIYAGHPEALQLRAMNIIYETTKERGSDDPDAQLDGRQHESLWQTRWLWRSRATRCSSQMVRSRQQSYPDLQPRPDGPLIDHSLNC
jgi:hypothetical protein